MFQNLRDMDLPLFGAMISPFVPSLHTPQPYIELWLHYFRIPSVLDARTQLDRRQVSAQRYTAAILLWWRGGVRAPLTKHVETTPIFLGMRAH